MSSDHFRSDRQTLLQNYSKCDFHVHIIFIYNPKNNKRKKKILKQQKQQKCFDRILHGFSSSFCVKLEERNKE